MSSVFNARDWFEQNRLSEESMPLPDAASPNRVPDSSITAQPQPPRAVSKQSQRLTLSPEELDPHLVTLLTPSTLEAEHYRALGQQLEQMHNSSGLHVMAVSSPTMGDGKTTMVLNLAGVMAQLSDMKVLLIDMDLRRPAVHSYLGLSSTDTQGLVDGISHPELSLVDVVTMCDPYDLAVLPAGRATDFSYDLLKSPRLGELLTEARQSYDFIIIDTPPLVPLADCRFIEKWVDGFLMIVNAHKTLQKFVDEALGVLEPSKIVGLIFNRDEHIISGDYSYYYSRYTKSTGRPSKKRSRSRHHSARR